MPRLYPEKLFKLTQNISNTKNLPYIQALAPMEPFTANPILREFAAISGAHLIFRPKINPFQLLEAQEWQQYEKIKEYENFEDRTGKPVYDGIQLISRPDDPIKGAVKFIQQNKDDLGISFIDLNFCCPGQKVLKQNRGGELLLYPEKIRIIVEKVLKHTSLPVSLKIRKGYTIKDTPEELCRNIRDLDIAWITINRAPVKMEGIDFSELKTDICAFQKAANILEDKIPIIANGDIDTQKMIDYVLSVSGVKGIMIGRSALKDPMIFSRLNNVKNISSQFETTRKLSNLEIEELFSNFFKIVKEYRDGNNQNLQRWTELSKVKLLIFYLVQGYLESSHRMMPRGYGWGNWRKNQFTRDSLIKFLSDIFPFIPQNKWNEWIL